MKITEPCNTIITTGFNLHDIPTISDRVREAIRLKAQDPEYDGFPTSFACSHCNEEHSISQEAIQEVLFKGPGAYDFSATANEYLAMIKGVPASSIGLDESNSFVGSSSFDLSNIVDPSVIKEDAPQEEEVKTEGPETPEIPEVKAESESEK